VAGGEVDGLCSCACREQRKVSADSENVIETYLEFEISLRVGSIWLRGFQLR
jgi:hypothetical protein